MSKAKLYKVEPARLYTAWYLYHADVSIDTIKNICSLPQGMIEAISYLTEEEMEIEFPSMPNDGSPNMPKRTERNVTTRDVSELPIVR